MEQKIKEQLEFVNQQLQDISGIYRKAINAVGVSQNEFWIWYTLIVIEIECSQQDICNMWSLSKQTVNTIITNMIQKEFVSLEVVPGTRNRKIVHLSEAGKNYGKEIVMPIVDAEQKAFERLSQKDRLAIMTALASYTAMLKEELNG